MLPRTCVWLLLLTVAWFAAVQTTNARDYYVDSVAGIENALEASSTTSALEPVSIYVSDAVFLSLTQPFIITRPLVLEAADNSVTLDCGSQNISALLIYSGNVSVINFSFTNCLNSAVQVNLTNAGPVVFSSCSFDSNSGLLAGAVSAVKTPDFQLLKCNFTRNLVANSSSLPTSTFNGTVNAAYTNAGAAVTWSNTGSGNFTISGCKFDDNMFSLSVPVSAAGHAVSALCFAPSLATPPPVPSTSGTCNISIYSSNFTNNWVGALYAGCNKMICNVALADSLVANTSRPITKYMTAVNGTMPLNMLGYLRSAFQVECNVTANTTATLQRSVFWGNLNGAIRMRGLDPATNMVWSGDSLQVINNTFLYGNRWRTGTAVRADSIAGMTLNNNTFAFNTYSAVYAITTGSWLPVGITAPISFINCTFDSNSADPTVVVGSLGGAVWFLSGSLVTTIKDCTFINNYNAWSGGALVYSQQLSISRDMILTVANSSFTNNSAVYGGAIYGRQMSAVTLIGSTFSNNNGVLGGAVYMFSGSRYTVNNCSFLGNAAYFDGPALTMQSMAVVFLNTTNFVNNHQTLTLAPQMRYISPQLQAQLDVSSLSQLASSFKGGAASMAQSLVTITFCNFVNNSADWGGAISLVASSVNITSTSFTSNKARAVGGALVGEVSYAELWSCTFTNNQALSGGAINIASAIPGTIPGLAVVLLPSITTSTFVNNTALSVSPSNVVSAAGTNATLATLRNQGCGMGGGGAICWRISTSVLLNSVELVNNNATWGGGIFLEEVSSNGVCNTSSSCVLVNIVNTTLSNNSATSGGGGIYWQMDNLLNINCTAAGGPASWFKPAVANVPVTALPCNSWTGNKVVSGYGPTIASGTVYLTSLTQVIPFYLADETLQVVLQLLDYYGQFATYPPSPFSPNSTIQATENALATSFTGETTMMASYGWATFNNLRLQGPAGEYVLYFMGTFGTQPMFNNSMVNVTVSPCLLNMYSAPDNSTCFFCRPGMYTYASDAYSCEVCPTIATCSSPNPTPNDPVGTGGILVPNSGYWHSNPWSEQVYTCPNSAACSYDQQGQLQDVQNELEACLSSSSPYYPSDNLNRVFNTSRQIMLGAFQDCLAKQYNYFNDIDNNTVKQYMGALCNVGYQGLLCGSCMEGYGMVGAAKCRKCYSLAVNTVLYILVSLVTLLFLLITLRSTVLDADAIEERLRHDTMLRSTMASQRSAPSITMPATTSGAVGIHNSPNLATSRSVTSESPLLPHSNLNNGHHSNNAAVVAHIMPSMPSATIMHDNALAPMPAIHEHESERMSNSPGWTQDLAIPPGRRPNSQSNLNSSLPENVQALVRSMRTGTLQSEVEQSGKSARMASLIAASRVIPEDNTQVSAAIKITVSYFQVLTIVRNIPISWPNMFNGLSGAFSQVTAVPSTAVSLDCSMPYLSYFYRALVKVLVAVMAPIYVTLFISAWWLVRALWLARRPPKDGSFPGFKEYMAQHVTVTSLCTIFYFYPSVCNVLLAIFLCENLDPGPVNALSEAYGLVNGRYWYLDFEQKCYHGKHSVLVAALGIPGIILFALGVPVTQAVFLWRHLANFGEAGFKHYYRFMYMEYDPRFYWWESTVMARKLLLLMVVVFMNSSDDNGLLQLLVAQLVLLICLFFQMWLGPFLLNRMDRLEALQLFTLSLSLYIVTYFTSPNISEGVHLALSIVVVLINVAMVLFAVLVIVKEATQGVLYKMGLPPKELRKMDRDKIKEALLKRFPKFPWLAGPLARLVHDGTAVVTRIENLPGSISRSVIAMRFVSHLSARGTMRSVRSEDNVQSAANRRWEQVQNHVFQAGQPINLSPANSSDEPPFMAGVHSMPIIGHSGAAAASSRQPSRFQAAITRLRSRAFRSSLSEGISSDNSSSNFSGAGASVTELTTLPSDSKSKSLPTAPQAATLPPSPASKANASTTPAGGPTPPSYPSPPGVEGRNDFM